MNIQLALIVISALAISMNKRKKIATKKSNKINQLEQPIYIGLFKAAGASATAVDVAEKFLGSINGIRFRTFSTSDVKNNKIDDLDIVFFTGGSGSRQGESLGESGREKIKEFVKNGGGYIGICAGSYLALQGEDEFNKLRIVAGKNATDYWKRGNKDVLIEADTKRGPIKFKMHYENGPIFAPVYVKDMNEFVPLGIYLEETWSTVNGTNQGEMIGTPVIAASNYGKGRVLLFGPNPMLGATDAVQFQMFLDAMNWVKHSIPVPSDLRFDEVFPSKIPKG